MKLTKCVNGHFYDEEKFEACPHCAGTSKLDASSIFGQSPEKPEFTATPKEADSVEEPEFAELPEEPEFTSAPKEAGFAELPEEPEFTSAPKEAGFEAPPEEPEFTSAPKAVSIEEEGAFDINAQPSFDTPLDFDNNFATAPAAAATDAAEEATDEEEGFPLLSKYGPDTPAEEVEEEPVANPELDDQPTEIVEEIGADLPNGLLSADEITGDISQPASTETEISSFSTEPEVPSFSAEPEIPSFSTEPEVPSFSAEPEIPSFSTEPEVQTFSAEPEIPSFATDSVNPAFVPEQPAAFDLSSEEDDDDEHTVAFYDDIFNEVSKTATVETPSTDAFADAAQAAAEVAAQAATAPAESPMDATSTEDTSGEPDVFTAPPLPHVQTLPTPCVGWLIALNGAHVGQDFHLRVGKNYVGRDESMDVALTGDKSVSRHKHAIIIYEPKHHKYFIQPGESNELIYVNDEVVLLPMELKPYDLLVLGDVELWFMPLCDADHNWSEVIRKLQEQM